LEYNITNGKLIMTKKTNEEKFIEPRKAIHPAQLTMAGHDLQKTSPTCELDHGGDPRTHPDLTAINTLMIKLHDGSDDYVALHVCPVCQESLNDPDSDWFLFICFTCKRTKWVHRAYLHGREYKDQIIGMNECPHCSEDQFKDWDD